MRIVIDVKQLQSNQCALYAMMCMRSDKYVHSFVCAVSASLTNHDTRSDVYTLYVCAFVT
jgi:hypothetical protein